MGVVVESRRASVGGSLIATSAAADAGATCVGDAGVVGSHMAASPRRSSTAPASSKRASVSALAPTDLPSNGVVIPSATMMGGGPAVTGCGRDARGRDDTPLAPPNRSGHMAPSPNPSNAPSASLTPLAPGSPQTRTPRRASIVEIGSSVGGGGSYLQTFDGSPPKRKASVTIVGDRLMPRDASAASPWVITHPPSEPLAAGPIIGGLHGRSAPADSSGRITQRKASVIQVPSLVGALGMTPVPPSQPAGSALDGASKENALASPRQRAAQLPGRQHRGSIVAAQRQHRGSVVEGSASGEQPTPPPMQLRRNRMKRLSVAAPIHVDLTEVGGGGADGEDLAPPPSRCHRGSIVAADGESSPYVLPSAPPSVSMRHESTMGAGARRDSTTIHLPAGARNGRAASKYSSTAARRQSMGGRAATSPNRRVMDSPGGEGTGENMSMLPKVDGPAFWSGESFTGRYTLDFRLADNAVRQRVRLFVLYATAELISSRTFETTFAHLWFKHVRIVRNVGSGNVPPNPAFITHARERNHDLRPEISALFDISSILAAANTEAGAPADVPDTAEITADELTAPTPAAADVTPLAPISLDSAPSHVRGLSGCPSVIRAIARATALAEGERAIARADSATFTTACATLSEEATAAQMQLQRAHDDAAAAALDLGWRALKAALGTVGGGRVHILTANGPRASFARVVPSTSQLLIDGMAPATLLGAIPGLGPADLSAHAHTLSGEQAKCGFRLILKSYEVAAIAPSMEEARAWVRGVNHLPLGGKHRQLLILMSKHAEHDAE